MQSNNLNENQNTNVDSLYDWKDALRLVEKMVQLGCFTENPTVFVDHEHLQDDEEEDIDESMSRDKSLNDLNFTLDDSNIVLSHTTDGEKTCCLTRKYLVQQIEKRLVDFGRLDLYQISNEFHIDFKDSLSTVRTLKDKSDQYCLVGEQEIVTSDYMDQLCNDLNCTTSAIGSDSEQIPSQQISISTLATKWRLPVSFTTDIISHRMHILQDWKLVRGIDGSKQIITNQLEKTKLNDIKEALEKSIEPVHMHDLIKDIQFWNMDLAVTFVQGLCETKVLDGCLHVHESSNLGAFYTPQIYEERQRNTVLKKYSMQGYITYTDGECLGLSRKQLKEIISVDAIFLQTLIINPNVFLSSLQLAIEECIDSESYVDLTMQLPKDISDNDAYQFLQDHVLKHIDSTEGRIIIRDGEVAYFSEGMVKEIQSSILPSLLQSHAKDEAMKFLSNIKISKKMSKSLDVLTISDSNMIPLSSFAGAVLRRYPELGDQIVLDNNLVWEQEDDDKNISDGIVTIFCRSFMSRELMDEYCRWIQREITKLLATKNGVCLHNDNGTGETPEQTFEETFKKACCFLQLLVKLPQYAVTNSEIGELYSKALCSDFLSGYATHFARRITEYCLIKNGIEDSPFSYIIDDNVVHGSLICYDRVDTTLRSFQPTFFSCCADDETDPIQLLKEMLPGNAAIAISEMWKLTNRHHFYKGTDEESFALSDIDAFMAHVEESCLTMVGIPFKRLDKKTEKSMMLDRKKRLLYLLDQSSSARDVLELSTMLLGYQLRNYVLCGNELILSALHVILEDKKVPESLRLLFKDVLALVQGKKDLTDTGNETVQRLKKCAMSKNMLQSKED